MARKQLHLMRKTWLAEMVINKIDQLAIAFGVEVRKGSIRYVDGRL
jgi:hypothetical protein